MLGRCGTGCPFTLSAAWRPAELKRSSGRVHSFASPSFDGFAVSEDEEVTQSFHSGGTNVPLLRASHHHLTKPRLALQPCQITKSEKSAFCPRSCVSLDLTMAQQHCQGPLFQGNQAIVLQKTPGNPHLVASLTQHWSVNSRRNAHRALTPPARHCVSWFRPRLFYPTG